MINKSRIEFIKFFVYLLPLALIFSRFVADAIVSVASLIFLLFLIVNRNFSIFNNRIIIYCIIFNFYLLFNSIITSSYSFNLDTVIFYFRFTIFALLIGYCVHNFNSFSKVFFYALLICYCFLIFDGYYQYITGKDILGYPLICVRDCNSSVDLQSLRLTGPFGSKMIIGSYLARYFPILLGLYFYLKVNNSKIINVTVILITLSTTGLILLSGERSSFFLFLVFIIMSSLFLNIRLKFKLFFISSIIFLIFFLSKLFPQASFRMFNFSLMQFGIYKNFHNDDIVKKKFDLIKKSAEDQSGDKIFIFSKHHDSHIRTAFNIFFDNPFFGKGIKSFRYVCDKYKIDFDSCTTHPHNILAQTLAEIGLFGFIFYIFFLIFLLKNFIFHYYVIFKDKIYTLNNSQICFYLSIFLYLLPIVPTGNVFNNWLSINLYLSIGFLISNRNN
jgi:O-antigen ligase